MKLSLSLVVSIGFGFSLGLARVATSGEVPTILVTPFSQAHATSTAAAPDFEAKFATRLETEANGRAQALLDVETSSTTGSTFMEADEVRALADESGATFVLVGEWRGGDATTDSDPELEAAVELRSGHSGATTYRYQLAWKRNEEGSENDEMGRVVRAMLQDLELDATTRRLAQVSAAGNPLGDQAPDRAATGRGKRTDFLTVSRDQPIEINSEELELLTEGDAKHLIFSDKVLVAQGEMRLSAGHLEAFYPDGASQPQRLSARRNVRVTEGDLEVRCFEVTYLREDGLVICRGDALLVQGCDEVRGEEIVFHLEEEKVRIKGAASVVLHLDQQDASSCPSGGTG